MTIVVAAAVIERDGRFLVTRRQKGVHLEGFWEFPGGKCDRDETLAAVPGARAARGAGRRSRIGEEDLRRRPRAIPTASVELHFFRCELLGEPRAAARDRRCGG